MVVDEEGLPKNKILNKEASKLAGKRIVGNVLLVPTSVWRVWDE